MFEFMLDENYEYEPTAGDMFNPYIKAKEVAKNNPELEAPTIDQI